MKKKSVLFFLLILFGAARHFAHSQVPAITGPNPLQVGATGTYSFTLPSVSAANDVEAVITVPSNNTIGEIVRNGNVCTVEITWTTPGSFIILAKNSGGGTVASTQNNQDILVNKPPVGQVSISGGSSTRCQGATNGTLPADIFSASATNFNSFAWSIVRTPGSPQNDGGSPGTISNGHVSWLGSFYGSATVKVIAYGDAGTSTQATAIVLVNKSGIVSISASNNGNKLCQYDWITLNAVDGFLSSYEWSADPPVEASNTPTPWEGKSQLVVQLSQTTTFTLNGIAQQCAQPGSPAATLTVEVTPRPVVTGINTLSSSFCQGSRPSEGLSVEGSNVGTTTWSSNDSAAGSFSGNVFTWLPHFAGEVTLSANAYGIEGCVTVSVPVSRPFTVFPLPVITASPEPICSGSLSGIVLQNTNDPTFSNTTVSWTAASGSVGGAFDQPTGSQVIQQTLTNSGTTSAVQTYNVTAYQNGCAGASVFSISITVKPKPTLESQSAPQPMCSGDTTAMNLSSNIPGTKYTWTQISDRVTGASNVTTATTALKQLLTTTVGNVQGTVKYSITPVANSCSGPSRDYFITVKPTPDLAISASQVVVCDGYAPSPAVAFTDPKNVAGTLYTWTATAKGVSGITTPESPTTSAAINVVYNLTNPTTEGTANYTNIRATANGCSSPPQSLLITVPAPTPPASVNGTARFRSGPLTFFVPGASPQTLFKWYSSSNNHLATQNQFTTPNNVTASTSNYMNVRAQDANGCWSRERWFDVLVMDPPAIVAERSFVVKGEPIDLSVPSSFDTYEWRKEGVVIDGNSSIVSVRKPGTYTVRVGKLNVFGISDPITIGGQFDNVDLNYVVTNIAQVEIKNADLFDQHTVDSVSQQIQYFDGLGRPMQTVNTLASPQRGDVIQPIVYDAFGREAFKYLPVTVDNGSGHFFGNIAGSGSYGGSYHHSYYNSTRPKTATDPQPYAQTIFEPSPLNRVVEQGSPGATWQPGIGKNIKKVYRTNANAEVLRFNYDPQTGFATIPQSLPERYYVSGELSTTDTYDEHDNVVIEFVDKDGRMVCKKVSVSQTMFAETYYIYDDLGNLVVVLPPQAVAELIKNQN